MEKLIQLFEEIKWFLRTNGQGWPKPLKTTPQLTIEPINFETEAPKTPSCCSQLFYMESEQSSQGENSTATTEIIFPLPFFDSRVRPSAVAVPFRRFTLRNIESRRASHIILKFFIAATTCLNERKSSKATTLKFHNSFFGWLNRDVLTKIEDDKFYSAFGGILRIEETLKAMGAVSDESTCIPEGEQEILVPEAGVSHKHFTSSVILIVMLVIILLWFLIGTIFICLRMRRSQKKQDEKDQTKSNPTSSSSLGTSKWSLFSKSKSDRSVEGKCKCSSKTSASAFSSSYTSDYDLEERIKKRKQKQRDKAVTICYPPYLGENLYMEKNRPAVIDTQTTMKKLPSIEEISEVTTENRSQHRKLEGADNSVHIQEQSRKHGTTTPAQNIRYATRCPNINYASSSTSKLRKKKQPPGGMIIDECWCDILRGEDGEIESVTLDESFPGVEDDMKGVQQRRSTDKTRVNENSTRKTSHEDNTNYSKGMVVLKHSSTEKSRSGEMPPILSVTFSGETDQSGQKLGEPGEDSQAAFDARYGVNSDYHEQRNHDHTVADLSYEHYRPEESTAEETSEANTDKERISTHQNACHSSLTGTYSKQMKDGRPFIFGYDLETSSSSDLSEEETDLKTSTSK
ncbi:uncharacterized protein LOC114326416 isoform X2 [Diabrotica virgifera virgifera]|nr:uncharacterized protein LOC114326416 isoform X2 [Diabrotica virgifera virgifera]